MLYAPNRQIEAAARRHRAPAGITVPRQTSGSTRGRGGGGQGARARGRWGRQYGGSSKPKTGTAVWPSRLFWVSCERTGSGSARYQPPHTQGGAAVATACGSKLLVHPQASG